MRLPNQAPAITRGVSIDPADGAINLSGCSRRSRAPPLSRPVPRSALAAPAPLVLNAWRGWVHRAALTACKHVRNCVEDRARVPESENSECLNADRLSVSAI